MAISRFPGYADQATFQQMHDCIEDSSLLNKFRATYLDTLNNKKILSIVEFCEIFNGTRDAKTLVNKINNEIIPNLVVLWQVKVEDIAAKLTRKSVTYPNEIIPFFKDFPKINEIYKEKFDAMDKSFSDLEEAAEKVKKQGQILNPAEIKTIKRKQATAQQQSILPSTQAQNANVLVQNLLMKHGLSSVTTQEKRKPEPLPIPEHLLNQVSKVRKLQHGSTEGKPVDHQTVASFDHLRNFKK